MSDADTEYLAGRGSDGQRKLYYFADKFTRAEIYYELMDAWIQQRDVADKKPYLPSMVAASVALSYAIRVLESTYPISAFVGVGIGSEDFYKKEIRDAHKPKL